MIIGFSFMGLKFRNPPTHGIDVETAHACSPHEFRHAVDHDHRFVLMVFKCSDQTRGVFTVHHVNDKDNIRLRQVAVDLQPLSIAQRRTKVVRRNTQIQIVHAINRALRVLQRRQQTRPDIEHRYVHATPSI